MYPSWLAQVASSVQRRCRPMPVGGGITACMPIRHCCLVPYSQRVRFNDVEVVEGWVFCHTRSVFAWECLTVIAHWGLWGGAEGGRGIILEHAVAWWALYCVLVEDFFLIAVMQLVDDGQRWCHFLYFSMSPGLAFSTLLAAGAYVASAGSERGRPYNILMLSRLQQWLTFVSVFVVI